MNLSPEIINRLVALKSLLDLGDMELASVASSRLEPHRAEAEIAEVLSALADHRYAEAVGLIDKLLSDGTRLARWIDPEVALLEAELEQVTAELADLEVEQAELKHMISSFQAAHHETLGVRVAKLLQLRMRILQRLLETDSDKRKDYDQACHDYDEFQREQDIQKEAEAKPMRELTEQEQAELKRLFRTGSKRCHPDLVPAEHRDAAAEMFRGLRKAYGNGDIRRLRELVKRAEAGLFDTAGHGTDSDERKKERLKARISGIRDVLTRSRASIQEIKRSSTYHTMTENEDWAALFGSQAKLLDQEIENLSKKLDEGRDV